MTKKSETEPVIEMAAAPSKEQLKQILDQERTERVRAAGEEIGLVLKKYNCGLDPVMVLRGGRIAGDIQIVPIED